MKARVAGIIIGLIVVIAAVVGGLYWHRASATNSGGQATNTDQNQPTPGANQLQITDEKIGTGAEAQENSTITVKYTGTLQDGTVFDSTDNHGGQPATFQLSKGSLIDGWVQGIPGMKVGGKRKLVIPPDLAYGADGSPPKIPGNATLTFEIELLSVQ